LPKRGVATVSEVSVPATQSSGGLQTAATSQGRINLNSASASDLEALPGIGVVKAGAIVAYREANGPFESVDAVLDVTGIGPTTLEGIRDLVEAR
jgi:competence protein ComEA